MDLKVCVLSPLCLSGHWAIWLLGVSCAPRQVVPFPLLFFGGHALTSLSSSLRFILTVSHLSADRVTVPLRHIDNGLVQDTVVSLLLKLMIYGQFCIVIACLDSPEICIAFLEAGNEII
jgi:hypothetical protein